MGEWKINVPLPEVKPDLLRILISIAYLPMVFLVFMSICAPIEIWGLIKTYWVKMVVPCFTGGE